MNDNLTEDLRQTTRKAFQTYGGQALAAREIGCERQYVWQILNGERENEDMLLKLSDFIINRIYEAQSRQKTKATKTEELKNAMAV